MCEINFRNGVFVLFLLENLSTVRWEAEKGGKCKQYNIEIIISSLSWVGGNETVVSYRDNSSPAISCNKRRTYVHTCIDKTQQL